MDPAVVVVAAATTGRSPSPDLSQANGSNGNDAPAYGRGVSALLGERAAR